MRKQTKTDKSNRRECRDGSGGRAVGSETERSCGRSLLLSLFSASSIQQGGAREPGVQPVQAASLCEAGSCRGIDDGGMGMWGRNGDACVCVGVMMQQRWRMAA